MLAISDLQAEAVSTWLELDLDLRRAVAEMDPGIGCRNDHPRRQTFGIDSDVVVARSRMDHPVPHRFDGVVLVTGPTTLQRAGIKLYYRDKCDA